MQYKINSDDDDDDDDDDDYDDGVDDEDDNNDINYAGSSKFYLGKIYAHLYFNVNTMTVDDKICVKTLGYALGNGKPIRNIQI